MFQKACDFKNDVGSVETKTVSWFGWGKISYTRQIIKHHNTKNKQF